MTAMLAVNQMSHPNEEAWRQSYPPGHAYPVMQWAEGAAQPMGGMHNTDLRMFHGEDYHDGFARNASARGSPHLSYTHEADWASDYSPSVASFAGRVPPAYANIPTSNPGQNLTIPTDASIRGRPQHSPTSSLGSASPQQRLPALATPGRPAIFRSHTAPDAIHKVSGNATSHPKVAGSDADEQEYGNSDDTKPSARKRQRIPHTAVERRYREALNAGIKSLQMAVAASKEAAADSPLAIDEKPSKSTILHSAIEQIHMLSSENSSLRGEVRTLQSRLGELEKWYMSQQQQQQQQQAPANFGGKY